MLTGRVFSPSTRHVWPHAIISTMMRAMTIKGLMLDLDGTCTLEESL